MYGALFLKGAECPCCHMEGLRQGQRHTPISVQEHSLSAPSMCTVQTGPDQLDEPPIRRTFGTVNASCFLRTFRAPFLCAGLSQLSLCHWHVDLLSYCAAHEKERSIANRRGALEFRVLPRPLIGATKPLRPTESRPKPNLQVSSPTGNLPPLQLFFTRN